MSYSTSSIQSPSASLKSADFSTPGDSNQNLRIGNSAQYALLENGESALKLSKMNRNQVKNYIIAMLCRGGKKVTKTSEEWTRSSFAMLSGIQLSGLLKCKTLTDVISWLSMNAWDSNQTISHSNFVSIKAAPVSLEETMDQYLKFPIRVLTYASAVGWLIAHSIAPPIERYLSTKEDVFMRKLIGSQGNREEKPVIKWNTTANKVSYLIEYVMPILFDATQTALFLRYMRSIGDSLGFWPKDALQRTDLSDGDLHLSYLIQVQKIAIEMLSGEDPVSDLVLYLLLSAGVVLYLVQAWCNFHHDLQMKEAAEVQDDQG